MMRVVFMNMNHQVGRIDWDNTRFQVAPERLEDVLQELVYDADGKLVDRKKEPAKWMRLLPMHFRSPYFCAVLKENEV